MAKARGFEVFLALLVLVPSTLIKSSCGCFNWRKDDKAAEISCSKEQDNSCHTTRGARMAQKGERDAYEMMVDLFKNVELTAGRNQANYQLFPVEIGRIVSFLIQASSMSGDAHHQETLNRIRCYIERMTKYYQETFQVPADDGQNDEEEEDQEETGGEETKMLAVKRQIFFDENFKHSANFSTEAYCWYDIELTSAAFDDPKTVSDIINDWATETHQIASRSLPLHNQSQDPGSEPSPLTRTLVATDLDVMKKDLMIVVSSLYLKGVLDDGLVTSSGSIDNQLFNTGKRTVNVTMMTLSSELKVYSASNFEALSLPTKDRGSFVVVLPRRQSTSGVERELFGSGRSLESFIESFDRYSQAKKAKVLLPKLNLQITHEWTTPANRTLDAFQTNSGKHLSGGQIGIYQDTFLDLEFPDTGGEQEGGESLLEGEEGGIPTFNINRPFLFLFLYGDDVLVSIGKISDPTWCRTCLKL